MVATLVALSIEAAEVTVSGVVEISDSEGRVDSLVSLDSCGTVSSILRG